MLVSALGWGSSSFSGVLCKTILACLRTSCGGERRCPQLLSAHVAACVCLSVNKSIFMPTSSKKRIIWSFRNKTTQPRKLTFCSVRLGSRDVGVRHWGSCMVLFARRPLFWHSLPAQDCCRTGDRSLRIKTSGHAWALEGEKEEWKLIL